LVYESGQIIIIILACLLLGALGAFFISRYAFRLGLIDLPNDRSSHSQPTPRGGGIGVLAVFIIFSLIIGISKSFWVPASLLSTVSFFDDRLGMSPRTRLFFQFFAAVIVISSTGFAYSNLYVLLPILTFFAFYIVGTTNFYNFMDGINGIAGITGVVVFTLIALFTLIMGNQEVMLLSVCISAACLGYLPFNVPKARVFMGDVGSILLGFSFAAIVVKLSNNLSSFLCLAFFLSLFYADALSTLFIRWMKGEKLFQAHRSHLYQILANELSISHWKISLAYGLLQLIFGLVMIWAWRQGLSAQVIVILLFSLVFLGISWLVRKVAINPAHV